LGKPTSQAERCAVTFNWRIPIKTADLHEIWFDVEINTVINQAGGFKLSTKELATLDLKSKLVRNKDIHIPIAFVRFS
jgi:hypothetical protein